MLLFFLTTLLSSVWYSEAINRNFWDENVFEQLKSVILSVGASLIGATAITFSFVMFSIQVNIDRLSHGLFGKFSFDKYLLGSFVLSFILAISVCLLSLAPYSRYSTTILFIGAWCTFFILNLFFYAYRRALKLVSPIEQLNSIIQDVQRSHKLWDKAYNRTKALIKLEKEEEELPQDWRRLKYLSLYSHWSVYTNQAIKQCISISRAYSGKGDVDIANQALSCVITINALYINFKGKTFFSQDGIIDNPLSSDSIFNSTLEEVRQNMQMGQTNKNENYILQNLRTLFELSNRYYQIDYGNEGNSKTHAHIAQYYLYSAIDEICIPNKYVEVILEGVRLIGRLALLESKYGEINYIRNLSNKLQTYSLLGLAGDKYHYVTQLSIEQISNITAFLVAKSKQDITFVSKDLANSIEFSAKLFLKTKETNFTRIHSQCYSPFFSGASESSFLHQFNQIANHICSFDKIDDGAQNMIRNIVHWLPGVYELIKDMFVESIIEKSSLFNDIIHWNTHVVKCLLNISNSVNSNDYQRDELHEQIIRFASIFTWVPSDKEAVNYAEIYSLTDNAFRLVLAARRLDMEPNISLFKFQKLFLSWGKKAGRVSNGWNTVGSVVVGSLAIDLLENHEKSSTFNKTNELFVGEGCLPIEQKIKLISYLRDEFQKYQRQYNHSLIENTLAKVNQEELDIRLSSLADALEESLGD
jgi:hypothetical protein